MKNWKTTIAGVAVIAIGVAHSLGWLNSDITSWAMQGLVALGFVSAGDAGNNSGK